MKIKNLKIFKQKQLITEFEKQYIAQMGLNTASVRDNKVENSVNDIEISRVRKR